MKLGNVTQAGSKIQVLRREHGAVYFRSLATTAVAARYPSQYLGRGLVKPSWRDQNVTRASFNRRHPTIARYRFHQSTLELSYPLRSRPFSTSTACKAWFDPATETSSMGPSNPASGQISPESIKDPEEHLMTRRIHLLGTGSIGTLVAHALKILPNPPPVTLMMHRQERYEDFKQNGRLVRLINKQTSIVDETDRYDVDLLTSKAPPTWQTIFHEDRGKPIYPLQEGETMDTGETFIYTCIVTVKASATVDALKSVMHRMDSRTTILLMQNGMGQIDDLNSKVFTDPRSRPTYMLGIISHGCHSTNYLNVVHAGMGAVALGVNRDTDKFPLPPDANDQSILNLTEAEKKAMFPTEEDLYANTSARYLLRTLTRSTVLACALYPYLDLLQLQLEKLVGNCLVNPLTALLDFENGAMLEGSSIRAVQRLLIAEISVVLRGLPELEGVPNVEQRFSPSKLEAAVDNLSRVTAKNSSSMREDVRKARPTEIDYINGYVVKRGEEQGIRCALNYMIQQMVNAKTHHQAVTGERITHPQQPALEASEDNGVVVLEDKSKW